MSYGIVIENFRHIVTNSLFYELETKWGFNEKKAGDLLLSGASLAGSIGCILLGIRLSEL